MSLFGRRMTPELLATELLRGLESGDVVFDDATPAPAPANEVEELRAAVVAAAAAPTFDEARAILAKAVQTADRLRGTS